MLYTLFEKKEKEEKQSWKKKEQEENQAEKQINSHLAQIEFFVEGVLFIK